MINKKIIALASVLALTLVAFSAAHVVAKPGGGGCIVRDNGCQADDISLSIHTGPPFTPCLQGANMYRFSATITCGIGFGDPVTDIVCAVANNPISFSLNGQTHTFQPVAGADWQDVKDDCQNNLTYSVN